MGAKPVKIEAFIGQPPCPGCLELEELCREMSGRLGERLELKVFKGTEGRERMDALGLKIVPALVLEGLIRIEGICPSREMFLKALKEFGINDH
jgi:hypothetical protein